jgi:hypothetical protein
MTEQLLQFTGFTWEVTCFADGNRRKPLGVWYIRCSTRQGAKDAAIKLSGGKHAIAWPWDPGRDLRASEYIRAVVDNKETKVTQ